MVAFWPISTLPSLFFADVLTCALVATPEVDKDNADTVEGVNSVLPERSRRPMMGFLCRPSVHRCRPAPPEDAHDGGEDVDSKEEEENRDTGNAVSNPRSHMLTAAVGTPLKNHSTLNNLC